MKPERWLVLTARVADAELRPLAADALLALGGAAVLEEADALVTYLPEPPDPDATLAEARHLLGEAIPGVEADVVWRWQDDEDWALKWKQGLQPRHVSHRLVVKPTWCEWTVEGGEIVVDIDPQMAFGTGEHATTRGCLRLLDGVIRGGERVVDVGSGSGILAIAAVRLGAREALAIENDPDANLNAHENLERNGVAERVRIVEALADAALLEELGRFDLILANILSGVIRPLLPAFHAALGGSTEGRLIVSGILAEEHATVVADAERAGFRVVEVDEEQEWWSALLAPRGQGEPT
jgi:ribosomal protein L11 methyltransferase